MSNESVIEQNNAKQNSENEQNNAKHISKQKDVHTTIDAEIIDGKAINTGVGNGDEDTGVSDYFENIAFKATIKPVPEDETPVTAPSSFSEFDVFNDNEQAFSSDNESPMNTEIEVYQEAEAGESDVLRTTGDVAKMFNVSNQTIRNTADFFVEILSDERGATGQKLYNSEDIAIIEKIFYMTNVQKYKRRDIREQFLKNGISAKKGINSSQEINFENLPKAGPPVPSANENTELLQEKISNALTLLQKNVIQQVNEGFATLEHNIKNSFTKDIKDSSSLIGEKIHQTKEELLETIKKQNETIKEQHDQIIKLKSTIININKAVLKIESSVSGMGEGVLSKEVLTMITDSIDEVIKSCSTSEMQQSIEKLTSDTQNTAKQLRDEITKQNNSLSRLENSVTKIEQNTPKNDKERQNSIKAEVADTLNRNYQKIEKVIRDNSRSQLENIDNKLSEIATALRQDNAPVDDTLIDELNRQLADAISSIDTLSKENEELENKKLISQKIIDKQSATIEDLKGKIQQNAAKASQTDNTEVANKLLISQKLVEKLSKENEELKTKGKIKDLIISKQDVQLKQHQENPHNDVFDGSSVQNNVKEAPKTNTEDTGAEAPMNASDKQAFIDLLMDD